MMKFHCDSCDAETDNNKPFAFLRLSASQVVQTGEMFLCGVCTERIIRATKKNLWDKSEFFPENFGELPTSEPSNLPAPPSVAEPADFPTKEPDCTAPILVSAPTPDLPEVILSREESSVLGERTQWGMGDL